MLRIQTPWIFTLGAGIYEALTAQEPWRRHCRSMAGSLPAARILDLGTGPGVSAIELARAAPTARVVGIDTSAPMLSRAHRNVTLAGVPLTLVRGDALRLPFRDATYDGAAGHSFLYLLRDSRAALREVYRVVRAGGTVAFLEPNDVRGTRRWTPVGRAYAIDRRFGVAMLLWSFFSALHGRYTPARLGAELSECGFVEPRVTSAFGGLGLVGTARRPACDGRRS